LWSVAGNLNCIKQKAVKKKNSKTKVKIRQ
jgi:hypothetical protein